MQIQLTLSKALITEAVKADTYLYGKQLRAAQQNGAADALAYNATAGDETTDERKIDRDIRYATERLKTIFVDYITPSPIVKGNDMIAAEDNDKYIIFHLTVSQRWNGTLTDACARLSSRYIQDCATMLWYQAIGDKQAEYYAALVKNDETEVRKCFIKTPPQPPTTAYPSEIQFQQPLMNDASLTLNEDDDFTITYTLNADAIDDIETRSDEPAIAATYLDNQGRWHVKAIRTGVTNVTLFSRHNDTVSASFELIVTKNIDKKDTRQHGGKDRIFQHHPYR